MRIPSYDDLTPPIEEASIRDTFAQVARLCGGTGAHGVGEKRTANREERSARSEEREARSEPRSARSEERGARSEEREARSDLFACVRSPRAPQALVGLARDFSPRLERHDPACVVFDVGGLTRLLGDAHAIGVEIHRAAIIRGGSIRVAVASTQTAAMLLTLVRSELTVAPGDPAAAVAELPISVLGDVSAFLTARGASAVARDECTRATARPRRSRGEGGPPPRALTRGPGCARLPSGRSLGPQALSSKDSIAALLDTFERWGLRTLGDVAALPAADLSQRLGQAGVRLQRMARGMDLRPLVPDPDVPRFTGSLELEWPLDTLEPLAFVLARLLDPLAAALERADRAAAAIRLDLRLVDRTSHARTLLLPAALRDPKVLRTLLLLDLESHPPQAAVDVVSLELDPAPSRIVQYSLLDRAVPTPEAIATLTARLNALVGDTRCGSPVLLDTHRPDAFEIHPLALSDARRTGSDLRHANGDRAATVEPRGASREERAANGAKRDANLPLRRFRPPVAIRVVVEQGRPVHVHVDRRGMPGGRIAQRAGPWRTSGGWWTTAPAPWNRDEWDVAFADGTVCRIARDRGTSTWVMEGVLD